MIELTEHQRATLADLLDLHAEHNVCALRGLAGTGKTSVIPHLQRSLLRTVAAENLVISAPTNQAAHVLRRKGIVGACTVNQACSRPFFTERYQIYQKWVETAFQEPDKARNAPLPEVLEGRSADACVDTAIRCGGSGTLMDISMKVNPMSKENLQGWVAREYLPDSVLIVDEGSMLGDRTLAMAQEVFDRVILIGDPGQLPPVEDKQTLPRVPGVELTEIHRQAQDSPIVRFAYGVRNGVGQLPVYDGIEKAAHFDPNHVILVYRNDIANALNKKLRKDLGHPAGKLGVGEPLICRSLFKRWKEKGLVNNSMWTYAGDGWVRDPGGQTEYVGDDNIYIEGMTQGEPAAGACVFWLGYAITVHRSQGSEWPTVQVHIEDLMTLRKRDLETYKKLVYTAVTRASERLILVHPSEAWKKSA